MSVEEQFFNQTWATTESREEALKYERKGFKVFPMCHVDGKHEGYFISL